MKIPVIEAGDLGYTEERLDITEVLQRDGSIYPSKWPYPQSRAPIGATSTPCCRVCHRCILASYQFCCLSCKLEGTPAAGAAKKRGAAEMPWTGCKRRKAREVFIDYHCKVGMMEKADSLFMEMQEKNLKPTAMTFASLLQGFKSIGNVYKMFSLFDELLGNGIEPDEAIYDLMLGAYNEAGKWTKAFQLLEEMSIKGLTMKTVPDSGLIVALSEKESSHIVLELLFQRAKEKTHTSAKIKHI